MQMQNLRAGDRGERGRRIVIGLALELDGADEIAHQARRPPRLDQPQQARRIAGDVGEQPIDGADAFRREGEGAFAAPFHSRHCRYLGIERRLGQDGAQGLQEHGTVVGFDGMLSLAALGPDLTLRYILDDPEQQLDAVLRRLTHTGARIADVQVAKSTLEEVFIKVARGEL